MHESAINRFKSLIEKTDGCWLWKGSRLPRGYGRFYFDNKGVYAHRLALQIFRGLHVPADRVVMHSCDNPSCCNPDHLSVGTQTENMRDASAKGRTVNRINWKGEFNPKSRLTTAQVEQIKKRLCSGERPADLAREFGVGRARITAMRQQMRDEGLCHA